jgi:hypothetical protein
MDTDPIVKESRARFDHNRNKQVLKEKYEAKMLFAAFGGMWKAGPELLGITLVYGTANDIVLLDEYDTPCKVNPGELHIQTAKHYQEQLNAWLEEYNQLRRNR